MTFLGSCTVVVDYHSRVIDMFSLLMIFALSIMLHETNAVCLSYHYHRHHCYFISANVIVITIIVITTLFFIAMIITLFFTYIVNSMPYFTLLLSDKIIDTNSCLFTNFEQNYLIFQRVH